MPKTSSSAWTVVKSLAVIAILSLFPLSLALPGERKAFADSSPILSFIPLSSWPSNVAVDSANNMVYAATTGAILIVDGTTDTQVGTIPIPADTPFDIAVNPKTDTIYASTGGLDSILVINGATKTLTATIALGDFAGYLGLNPATDRIFVEHGSEQVYSDKISVIDGVTNSLVGSIALDRSSYGDIATNPVTNTIYIGSVYATSVDAVDGNTFSVVAKIPVGIYPYKVAVNPNSNMIYVTNFYDDSVSVINGQTNNVMTTIPITGYSGDFAGVYPIGIDVDTSTNRVYVADETGNAVSIIDGNTNTVTSIVNLVNSGQSASMPQYVSVNPNTGKAYVSANGNSLAMIHYADVTQTTSTVTVNSVDSNNSPLRGYYTTISQNGAISGTGFTPVPFTVTIGQTYTVGIQDYGDYYFSHWSDNGSTARARTFTATMTPLTLTAVFSTTPSSNTTNPSPTGDGISRVLVQSQDASGNAITGYYTILSQNGATVNSAFTPTEFPTTSGQTYTVEVQDYGDYHFNHWSDTGGTNRDRAFIATPSTQTLTAIYSTGQDTSAPTSMAGQSKISVSTVDSAGNPIVDYYVSVWQNGQQIDSAFSPASITVGDGQTYQIAVSDYGSYAFDHWSDGTTSRFHDVTTGTGTDTALTAIYKVQ